MILEIMFLVVLDIIFCNDSRILSSGSSSRIVMIPEICSVIFPDRWQVQSLALINKGEGDPETPFVYRPLCMLDMAGKLLERLLKQRLCQAVEESGGLSNQQYGFCAGRSTLGVVGQVVITVQETWHGNRLIMFTPTDNVGQVGREEHLHLSQVG